MFIIYDDVRLQCFKYVGAGLATISLAAQELYWNSFCALLASFSMKSSLKNRLLRYELLDLL